MDNNVFCTAGSSPALTYAKDILVSMGFRFVDTPGSKVTHLLLPIPSFTADGQIKGGGNIDDILTMVADEAVVIGGHLGNIPGIDLLKDLFYVTQNAALTADCAMRFAAQRMDIIWKGCKVLILGWGRIGKCLSELLKVIGADVTVAARKETDQALAAALGLRCIPFSELDSVIMHQDVIFNTVPAPILTEAQTRTCRDGCLLIELASKQGILGGKAIPALGLPGQMVPKSSGKLIAQTIIRLTSPKEG